LNHRFARLVHRLRNALRGGRLAWLGGPRPPLRHVHVVSATRMDEEEFWKSSALGQSLAGRRADARFTIEVAYGNREGLPKVYNRAIAAARGDAMLLFVHDDIWLDDPKWLDKLFAALERYDVAGLAGNQRRVPGQPAWLYTKVEGERAWLDEEHLSGSVRHGQHPLGKLSYFGRSPRDCESLDGLFIAARADVLKRCGITFDERFEFHHYDIDFCRTAREAGASMGTWPILVTHQSTGAFNSPGWFAGRDRYLAKWGS
jgi:GT2 family glycosyltransferase